MLYPGAKYIWKQQWLYSPEKPREVMEFENSYFYNIQWWILTWIFNIMFPVYFDVSKNV